MAAEARQGEQLRALARVKSLQAAARAALPAIHALAQAAEADVWGRYEISPTAPLDVGDLAGWLALAADEYPGQPLVLLLVVPQGP